MAVEHTCNPIRGERQRDLRKPSDRNFQDSRSMRLHEISRSYINHGQAIVPFRVITVYVDYRSHLSYTILLQPSSMMYTSCSLHCGNG
jgi:hypothetical protein